MDDKVDTYLPRYGVLCSTIFPGASVEKEYYLFPTPSHPDHPEISLSSWSPARGQ